MKKIIKSVCLITALFLVMTTKAQLSGPYTVPGSFASVAAAINSLNIGGVSGPVTIDIAAGYTETVSVGGFSLNVIIGASSTNSIVFQKSGSGANPILYAYAGGTAVPSSALQDGIWQFVGTDYVTIDGIDLNDPNTTNPSTMEYGYGFFKASATDGCQQNTIKNCVIMLSGNNTATGSAPAVDGSRGIDIVNASLGTHTTALVVTAASGSHSDNTFSGNTILSCNVGISAMGFVDVTPFTYADQRNNITNNEIGPVATGTNNIGWIGVYITSALNFAVASNTIQSIVSSALGGGIAMVNSQTFSVTTNTVRNFTTSSGNFYGINVNSFNDGFSVAQNTITGLYSSASSSGATALAGVYVGNTVTNGTVSANVVQTIVNTNTGGYGVRGMIVNTGVAASNINIRNNFISDIYCFPDYVSLGSFQWAPVGIHINGTSTGGVNIDFNTVNLFGTHAGYAASSGPPSAALYVNATGNNFNVRNNIFVNTYDNSSFTTDVVYAIYSAVAAINFSSIDNNDYYAGGTSNVPYLGYLGANQTNIAGIQTVFGGNVNSKNVAPVFISNTDLHLQSVIANAGIDNLGSPISGITTDIDGLTRNLTTPDMGAHEFTTPNCTTANGGLLSSSSATICDGQFLSVSSTGVSVGLTTSYLWKVGATAGGPYVPVTGGTGSTTVAYTSPTLAAGIYFVVLETSCAATSQSATSNEGTLTVNAVPTATASSTNTLICSGTNLNLSGASDIATSYLWNGPGSYTSGTQNPSISSAPFTASGSYSLTTSVNGCASTMAIVTVTVNSTPSSLTVTPSPVLICAGSSETISVTGGAVPAVFNFTPQTNQNGSTSYPAPYSAYYGGQKMQFLVLASELTGQGLVAGPLTSIQFPVVSKGSNWGTTINDNQSFQVSIKSSSLISVGATFETGLTIVAASVNFTPTVGYNNIHNFSTPFAWDGTSNLIIETVFSNNFSGGGGDAVIQYNSATPFQSTMVYRGDSQTFSTMSAQTTTNVATNLVRPDFKLNGSGPATYSWSPGTGLSATTGLTVNATPLANTIYTVKAINGTCSSSVQANVNITALPTLSIASTASAVCAGDQATLTVTGATTFTWDSNVTSSTLQVTPLMNTTYTVSNLSAPCPLVTETITIVANPLPTVTAVSNPVNVCAGQSATLTAGGASAYVWTSGPSTNSYVVSPATNTTYSVTGTNTTGCSGQTTVGVAINAAPVVIITPTSATVCVMSAATFTATGATTYSWSNGGSSAAITVAPVNSGTYSVIGTNSAGCSASQTVSLTANALPIITVSPASPTICTNESVVLTASGAASYSWMPGSSNTNTIMFGPAATSTTYVIEGQGANTCKNTTTVTITVDPCTGVREQNGLSGNANLYPNPSTGVITAHFGFEGSKDILVLNSVGAMIMKTSTEEASATFDLSAYAKGVYFVRVTAIGTSANYKIVIQ